MVYSMAKKFKSITSLLDELDKLLYECRWKDIEAILKKTKKKVTIPDAFNSFLAGLELVENHLLGPEALSAGQSTSVSSVHPDTALLEAESNLKKCINLCQPGHDASIQQLAKIKLGQLLCLRGDYEGALGALVQEVQNTIDLSLLHNCKVLLEGYLYVALCKEEMSKSDSDQTDHQYKTLQAVSAYEEAVRISLKLMHKAKSVPGGTVVHHPAALKALSVAIERAPLLAMQMNSRNRAINLYREVLQYTDESLEDLRLFCATSLASLLIFHSCPASYVPPTVRSHTSSFTPSNHQEEIMLVSFLAKSLTDSWVVCKTDPIPSPSVIYDLVLVALNDSRLHGSLIQIMEDGMRFACDMPHIWLQFALTLVSCGQDSQAMAVFHECINLSPEDPLVLCTAAKFAVDKADNPELGIKWANQAKRIASGNFLEPRIEFLLGRGYIALSERELSSRKRGELHKQSLVHLRRACELDSQNVDFSFHLALGLAESRDLVSAYTEIQRSLKLNTGHTSCLHLLALIFSAQKKFLDALKVCDVALQKQPENFGLLECKTKLEMTAVNTHQALKTCKYALQIWQKLFSQDTSGLIGIVTQDQHSLFETPLTPYERTSPHDINPDIASDAGSSHFSTVDAPVNQPNLLQARIWCTIAEVYASAGKIEDAISCVREAQYLAPHLSSVLVTHGQILEIEKEPQQSLDQYRNALSLQPNNSTTLTLIGQLLHHRGDHGEAEKYLREATTIDQLNHEAWYWLGEVFVVQDESEKSADCFKTALEFENTSPIQPFSAVLSSFVPST